MCDVTWDDVIEQRVDLLGKLPLEWWQKWDARSKVFNEEGVRIDKRVNSLMGSIEERFDENVQKWRRFHKMEEVSKKEKAALIDVLKPMLTFKPGDRMTAEQIVESKLMKEWALPELSRLKQAVGD